MDEQSLFLIVVLGACLGVPIAIVLITRVVVRAIISGRDGPRHRPMAWRFSLSAILVLGILSAGVFALLREQPIIAVFTALCVCLLWLPVAAYFELRRDLTDRARREFDACIRGAQASETE